MNSAYKRKLFITKIYKIFKKKQSSFRTLMYHSIFDEKIENRHNQLWSLKSSLFKEQINFIVKDDNKKIYKTETLLSDCPTNGISITFDDGYQNNLINAAPILKKYNFSATCYIVSESIGLSNKWDLKKNITHQHRVDGNKIIGVIIDNTDYVPIYPQKPILNIKLILKVY